LANTKLAILAQYLALMDLEDDEMKTLEKQLQGIQIMV
jgi:hypothetical protein